MTASIALCTDTAPAANVAATKTDASVDCCVASLLAALGEDVQRPGLLDTPKRVAKAWIDMTRGYRQNVAALAGSALFREPTSSMVVIRAIPFASISSTNLFPFFGALHIAYQPSAGLVLGLSKFARIARCLAARIQLQPELTLDLLTELTDILDCAGAAVVVDACHMTPSPHNNTSRCISIAASGCLLDSTALDQLLSCHLPTLLPRDVHHAVVSRVPADTTDPTLLHCTDLRWPDSAPPADPAMITIVQRLLSLLPTPVPPPLSAARAYCAQLSSLVRGYRMGPCALPPHVVGADSQPVQRWTVPFTSLCEHHMLPFCGRVCIAVADAPRCPTDAIAALVHRRALRLQVQERLTQELFEDVTSMLRGGAAVWCEAQHLCMVGRGVETPCSTQTSVCSDARLLRVAARDDEPL